MSFCAAVIFRSRLLYCLTDLAWSGRTISALITIGKSVTTSSRSTPGKVASGRSFRLMNEYSRPADLHVLIEFVLDVYVRYLASRAFVEDRRFRASIGDNDHFPEDGALS